MDKTKNSRGRIVAGGMLREGTPLEYYPEWEIWVKREDLACPPGPGLFKVRGLYRFVKNRPAVRRFGILDGRHSRNGWALARVCLQLEKNAIVYWPMRKADRELLETEAEGPTRNEARNLGAKCVPIEAGRSAVVFSRARNHLREVYPKAVMVPNAVKILETVSEVAAEMTTQKPRWRDINPKSIIVPCGTGTLLSGVARGVELIGLRCEVYGVMGYSQKLDRLRNYVVEQSGGNVSPSLVDLGGKYGQACTNRAPFPACVYYESAAWEWTIKNRSQLKPPVVFWNGGN